MTQPDIVASPSLSLQAQDRTTHVYLALSGQWNVNAVLAVARDIAAHVAASPQQRGLLDLLGMHGDLSQEDRYRLGLALGLSCDELRDLTLAALLHDIGLLTLPPDLVKEHRELSPQEFARYQNHPRAGAELLEPISFLKRPALWIAHHHERWDGCGYPYGLRGEFIPLGSRILAVADTFDAYRSHSLSPSASSAATASALLQIVAGAQLDPELVERFLQIVSTLTLADPTCSESH